MPPPKTPPGVPEPESRKGRDSPKVLFNWEDWLPYLDEMDATDTEKRQFIEALWSIIQAFVDLRWEVKDMVPESSGQVFDLTAELRAAVVDWKEERDQPEKELRKEKEGEAV